MRSPMDQKTFLAFYTNTILGCSMGVHNHICTRLELANRITFNAQRSFSDSDDIRYYENKRDLKRIIIDTTSDISFAGFYEAWEFSKLYKYSVPLFYETPDSKLIKDLLLQKSIPEFDEATYEPEMVLNTSLKDSSPS